MESYGLQQTSLKWAIRTFWWWCFSMFCYGFSSILLMITPPMELQMNSIPIPMQACHSNLPLCGQTQVTTECHCPWVLGWPTSKLLQWGYVLWVKSWDTLSPLSLPSRKSPPCPGIGCFTSLQNTSNSPDCKAERMDGAVCWSATRLFASSVERLTLSKRWKQPQEGECLIIKLGNQYT